MPSAGYNSLVAALTLTGIVALCVGLSMAWTRRTLGLRTKLIHSATSAPLDTAPQPVNHASGLTLIDLVKTEVTSLYGPDSNFQSVWWLPGGNAQTVYCSVGDFTLVDPVVYERKILRAPDGGTLALDITPPFSVEPSHIVEPILLVTHGLTGGSHESYVRAAVAALTAPTLPQGCRFRAVVLNSRGCNGCPVTSPKLYHAGTTDDIRSAVLWICHTFPQSLIFGLGFSLGANALTKYVGEEGPECPLSGVVSLANVWDFARGSPHIEFGSWVNRWVYDFVLGGALQALLGRHRKVFYSDPSSPLPGALLDHFLSRKYVRLREYDDVITTRLYGFKDHMDYYSAISSSRVVNRISIPCLAINSNDDPIVTVENIPICQILQSPWVVQAVTAGGGHMGWFAKPTRPGKKFERWYVKPTCEFLFALIEHGLGPRPRPSIVKAADAAMYTQQGRSDVGFMEIAEDTVMSGTGDSKLFSGW